MIPSENRAKQDASEKNTISDKKKINEVVGLVASTSWITVTVNGWPVMGYDPEDKSTCNSVIVQLLEAELLTLSEAVKGFGIARSTLQGALKGFKQKGIRGLIPEKSGPKEPWKLIPRTRRLLLDVVYNHPDWNMRQIMSQVNQQLESEGLAPLSGRHARRFLTSCGISTATTNRNRPAITDWQKENRQELAEFDPHIPTKEQSLVPVKLSCEPEISLTAADKRYLLQLEKGIDSAFAGGFLTVPFLALIQLGAVTLSSHIYNCK